MVVTGPLAAWLSCNGSPPFPGWDLVVVIGFPGDHRRLVKIKGGRRRRGLPLQASGVPGIRAGDLAVAQRPDEVDHRQQIAGGEYAGSGRGENVQRLEFRRILPVAAGHADVAENKLREERQVEADEDEQR